MVQCKEVIHTPPIATFSCEIGDKKPTVDFLLPITVNKFAKATKIPLNTMNQYYEEYTSNSNSDQYWSLDAFIKNPDAAQGQTNFPVASVLQKAGTLLYTGLN